MRLHIGAPPEKPGFDPAAEGWAPIREPGPVLIQFLALPVAIAILYALLVLLGFALRPLGPAILPFTAGSALIFFPGLVALLPIHEILHALCCPGLGLSPATLIGVWPKKVLLYAFHLEPMRCSRYLLSYATPLLVLSVLPIAGMGWLATIIPDKGIVSGLISLALVNALASAGDVVGLALLALQVPGNALVFNQGWRTFWKRATNESGS